MGQEALPEIREGSRGSPGSPGGVERIRDALQEVREVFGGPSGSPGGVGRTSQKTWRISWKTGRGREGL